MEGLTFNDKIIIFNYNKKEIVRRAGEDDFRSTYSKEEFEEDLRHSIKLVAKIMNEKNKRLANVCLARLLCVRSSQTESNQLSHSNGISGDIINVNDIESMRINVEAEDCHTVVVQIENVEDPTKKNRWLQKSISQYYAEKPFRPHTTIGALICRIAPVHMHDID